MLPALWTESACLKIREWTASGAVALQVEKCLVTTSGWLQFPELRHTLTGSGGTLGSYVSLGGAVAGTSFELDGMSLVLQ